MENFGIKVIRFKNNEVESDIEKVITEIKSTVNKRLQSPPWGI
jgi:very-short-patch-repair endonuclease